MCTRLGMLQFLNSSMSSSIMALTTPEASVPGISQCSQPWVWAIMATELAVPPTTKPASSSAPISDSTLAPSATMYSMLLRMVKRTWPSPYWSPISQSLRRVKTSRIRWVPAFTVQISSPFAATCRSTPGRGLSCHCHSPKFFTITGCMYWKPSGQPDSIGWRICLAISSLRYKLYSAAPGSRQPTRVECS